jgi:copper homeostasis protein
MDKFIIEACVGSVESALEAQKGGADRVELCSNLAEGGTTPSCATIAFAKSKLLIDTMVMIRPRGGDFCYSELEFEIMKQDIAFCKKLEVKGVVFGILLPEGQVDKPRTKELVEFAKPLEVCFHRAIDMTSDYFRAVEDIIECHCKRILTSGGKDKAFDALSDLKKLQTQVGNRIDLIVGSGICSQNIKQIYQQTGITQFHLSGKTKKSSLMTFHKPNVSMGGSAPESEYDLIVTDSQKIRSAKQSLQSQS